MKAPIQQADGRKVVREKGVPQGGPISPMISKTFMHHVFDEWMRQKYPTLPFVRYADDAIVHCKTCGQAEIMKVMIEERLAQYKLKLHPEKTQIVYCKDDNRTADFPIQSFGLSELPTCTRHGHRHRVTVTRGCIDTVCLS
jgi:RNA-directed DNA polymerase